MAKKDELQREAAFGRFTLSMLRIDQLDIGDRVGAILAHAARLGFGVINEDAEEDTDPWLVSPQARATKKVRK